MIFSGQNLLFISFVCLSSVFSNDVRDINEEILIHPERFSKFSKTIQNVIFFHYFG